MTRVILYDNTNRKDLGYHSPTLRILDADGSMALQGQLLAKDALGLAKRLAAGLQVDLEYVGPSPRPVAAATPATTAPLQTVDTPAEYAIQKSEPGKQTGKHRLLFVEV